MIFDKVRGEVLKLKQGQIRMKTFYQSTSTELIDSIGFSRKLRLKAKMEAEELVKSAKKNIRLLEAEYKKKTQTALKISNLLTLERLRRTDLKRNRKNDYRHRSNDSSRMSRCRAVD